MGCNSSAPASEPGARGGKGKGLTAKVEWKYFNGLGRGDPLHQMFEYHGQPHNKYGFDPFDGSWDKIKAEGGGGEFGGGLPQADLSCNGKTHNMGQFGAILRSFGIRYGYYDPADWKCAMVVDPIIDTWADVMNGLSKVLFGGGSQELIDEFCNGVFIKMVKLIERSLGKNNGKFLLGSKMSIGDFVAVCVIANILENPSSPVQAKCNELVNAANLPKFSVYRTAVTQECSAWLSKRPQPLPPL